MKKLKSKLYNNLMLNGKKNKCEKLIKNSVKIFQKSNKKNHKTIFKNSIIKLTPIIKLCEIKNKKKRKKKKKIFPYIINKKIRISLGIKELIKNIKKPLYLNLFKEIENQLINESETLNSQIETYKLSMKLKKSTFFRWFF